MLSSQTERFGNILSSIEGCTGLLRELTSAYDSLEPLIAGDYIDDDDSNPSRRSAPYDDDFYSCADRLFDAISCHCKTDVELRLRLGAFQSTYPPKDDRSLDVLVKGNDEAEEFWLTICLHCPPQPMYVLPDTQPATHQLFVFNESNKVLAKILVKIYRGTIPLSKCQFLL